MMAPKLIDPNQMSDIELKATVYDMSTQVENLKRNMDMLNQIIAQRAQAAAKKSEPEAVAVAVAAPNE